MTTDPALRALDEAWDENDIEVRRLDSGYWHIRGNGPCEWAQPPTWPCDEATLRAHAFPESSETFIRAALRASETAGEAG